MALIWIGAASLASPRRRRLGLSFASAKLVCRRVGNKLGALLWAPLAWVDLAAYSVMHELQLCQRITSVAPWCWWLAPLSHPCLDTSGRLTIRSVSPIYN